MPEFAPDALTDVESLRAWLGEEDAPEAALIDAINGVSRQIRQYLGRQLVPLEEDVTKRFVYDGGGILDLLETELRSAAPTITLYSDMPTSEQVVLSAADASSEAEYRLEPRGGTPEGTYLWVVLPRLQPKTVTTSSYAVDREDKLIEVSITGDWGAGVVPGDVKLAANIAAADAFRNPEGVEQRQLGQGMLSADQDDEYAFGLSKRVRGILRPYRRISLG
jgi:hypothetical protein